MRKLKISPSQTSLVKFMFWMVQQSPVKHWNTHEKTSPPWSKQDLSAGETKKTFLQPNFGKIWSYQVDINIFSDKKSNIPGKGISPANCSPTPVLYNSSLGTELLLSGASSPAVSEAWCKINEDVCCSFSGLMSCEAKFALLKLALTIDLLYLWTKWECFAQRMEKAFQLIWQLPVLCPSCTGMSKLFFWTNWMKESFGCLREFDPCVPNSMSCSKQAEMKTSTDIVLVPHIRADSIVVLCPLCTCRCCFLYVNNDFRLIWQIARMCPNCTMTWGNYFCGSTVLQQRCFAFETCHTVLSLV